MAKPAHLRATIRVSHCYAAESWEGEKRVCPFLTVKAGRAEAACYFGTTALSAALLPLHCHLRELSVEVVVEAACHAH